MTEEEKPLTREDVLRLIEEHGGPEKLDLAERNLERIDLSSERGESSLDLHGIILASANLQEASLSYANLQGANLARANLQGAYLTGANLQGAHLVATNLQGAHLVGANLQGAQLFEAKLQEANLLGTDLQGAELTFANLQGAHLRFANLSKARLYQAQISQDTILDGVHWGPKYILGDEEDPFILESSEIVYRSLKQCHVEQGMYGIAGEFYFREMTVRRKTLKWLPDPVPRAWSKFLAVLCGYGERPFRVVLSAAAAVVGMAGVYTASDLSFPSSLYYSAVSFTALGYGLWVPNPEGWVKALGGAEAFLGVFMMALFLITFVRRMTR